MRYEYDKKPTKCPECGSVRIAKIMCGLPTPDFYEKRETSSRRTGSDLGDVVSVMTILSGSVSIVRQRFIAKAFTLRLANQAFHQVTIPQRSIAAR
jgi:hypothetical protein